jgi:hypothetical protein
MEEMKVCEPTSYIALLCILYHGRNEGKVCKPTSHIALLWIFYHEGHEGRPTIINCLSS